MATFKEALEYAKQNPNSDFAKQFETGIKSGAFVEPARAEGFDVTPYVKAQVEQTQQGETGLQGVATGTFKSAANTVIGAGNVLQNIGTGITKAILPASAEKYFGVDQMGIQALNPETKIGSRVRDILKPQGTAEKIGSTITDVASYAIPGTMVGKATSGLGKVAQVAGQVASDVAVNAAQTGTLDGSGKQAITTAALSSLPLVGPLLGKIGVGKNTEKIATNIEKMNLRLSPLDSAKLAKSGDEVASFLSKQKISGTPEQRFAKIDELYNQFENKIQKSLTETTDVAKRVKYSKEEIIQSIKKLPDEFLSEANDPQVYNQLTKDVDTFTEFIKKQKGDFIDASKLNQYKRTYAKSARNKAGDVVVNDAREALSDGLYNLILKDNKELQKINKEYSKVILGRKLLGKALGRNEVGLIGNLIGMSTGAALGTAVGGPLGAAAGFTVGPKIGKLIAGTRTRSLLGSKIQSLAEYLNTAKVDEAGNFIIPRSIINGVFND